ncbi:choice-of-anchor A family protein [Actinomyces sp.]|uniref:choice-of-anchor A family protein n=1 Tax=Actinomyces sp. TaxID=29317 RepID=UPI00289D8B2E|nr:choice-of-anchor A family protein [Actinomyces sp.]
MALGLTAVTSVSADAADDAPAPDPTAICPGPGQIPDGSYLIFTGNGLDGHVEVFSVTADQLTTGGTPNFVDVGDATTLDISGTTQFMGSILAPNASAGITPNTNGRLFVGGDLTVSSKGQEHHSFPWIGIDAAPCRAGSVLVRKLVTGDGADAVPADAEYTMHHVATSGRPGAGSMEGDLVVRADERMVSGPTLDEGDTVTFSELTSPAVDGTT